jgi:hypothetical protein
MTLMPSQWPMVSAGSVRAVSQVASLGRRPLVVDHGEIARPGLAGRGVGLDKAMSSPSILLGGSPVGYRQDPQSARIAIGLIRAAKPLKEKLQRAKVEPDV